LKTAIITGVSGGIGSALCKAYLDQGYFVIGQYNANIDGLNALKSQLEQTENAQRFFPVQADFSKVGGAQEFCDKVLSQIKSVDVLICNAGVDVYKLLTQTDEQDWQRVFDVNVRSAFVLSKNFIPLMQNKSYGRVIYISSIWGVKGACMEAVYSSSKFALIGMAKSLAKEVGSNGITVNCICPGVVDTPMNDCFTDEELKQIVSDTPVQRICSPKEIADLALYLTNSGFVTGEAVVIDGGFTL
jgi:3-oxoacyl-[acyl-carrier protein] reductase